MRKTIAWIVLAVMLLGVIPAYATEGTEAPAATPAPPVEVAEEEENEEVEAVDPAKPDGLQPGTSITVGLPTELSGAFATDMWGTNTSDIDVRTLLHDYDTVAWTANQGLKLNDIIVTALEEAVSEEGGRIYTVQIAEDLTYNDGTPITVQDYLFSFLLTGSPLVAELGGTPQRLEHVVGYEAYLHGESEIISGIRMVSDYAFEMDVLAKDLPYFYDVEMISVKPYPISVIAPGCVVKDDGDGIYMAPAETEEETAADAGLGYTPGVFSLDMLRVTLMDAENGYLTNPQRTSGPYSLVSYDAAASTAEFTANTNYKGNYRGEVPHIEKLTVTYVEDENLVSAVADGTIDLANKVLGRDTVNEALELLRSGTQMEMRSYPRSGAAFLSFSCEMGPTDSTAVRRAIAMALDKDQLVNEDMSLLGTRVYGYYGIGQWFTSYMEYDVLDEDGELTYAMFGRTPNYTYDPNNPNVTPEPEISYSVEEMLDSLDVPMNLERAQRLLENDGWTLNEQGGEFQPGVDEVRYRQGADGLEGLIIRWAASENNPVVANIQALFDETLPGLGIKVELTELPFDQLLKHYYRQEPRVYHMFFIANNFNYIYDPYYDFHTDDAYQGMFNTTGIRDEELMNAAFTLRNTTPADFATYARKWMSFQTRFVDLMPMIPLYSNTYYDFYNPTIQGYNPVQYPTWAYSIVNAYINEDAVADNGVDDIADTVEID